MKYLKVLLALIASLWCFVTAIEARPHGGYAVPVTGGGASLVFNITDFSAVSSSISYVSNAQLSGTYCQVVDVASHGAGACWYKTLENIQAFTTTFTFQRAAGTGLTFVIQNTSCTYNSSQCGITAWADANMDGYGAFTSQISQKTDVMSNNTVGLVFDNTQGNQNSGQGANTPNAIGLFVNGGPYASLTPHDDANPSGLNLNSTNLQSATVTYDGTTLTVVVTDTVTGAQLRRSWPINIPAIVGANTAYIGFSGGNPPGSSGFQYIRTWAYYTGVNTVLGAPTISPSAGSYTSSQTVSMSAPSGSTIYYSTNGQMPTTASTQYTSPITVSANSLVQAVAVRNNFTDSAVTSNYYQIAAGGTNPINFPSGFTGTASTANIVGSAVYSGSAIALTTNTYSSGTCTGGFETGAVWFISPVSITSSWSTTFQMTITPTSGTWQNGFTFTLQNYGSTGTINNGWYSGGPNALSNAGTALGYGGSTGTLGQISGLLNSVSVAFSLNNGGTGGLVGLLTNGADASSISTSMSPVTLNSGNPINFTISYSGTTLSLTATDTVNGHTFSTSWTGVNISTTVGASTAYAGITASSNNASCAQQNLNSWTMT